MKKYLSIILVTMFLLLMVAGCGNEQPTTTTPESTNYDVNVKVLVGSEDGDGLGNVVLKDTDNKELATTNESGLAVIKNLSGEVSITPKHSEYIFEPEKSTVTKDTESIEFIAQPASNNAYLKEITLSAGSLEPEFSPNVLNYESEMPTNTMSIPTVKASALHKDANIEITQADNDNRTATIKVTAKDGTSTKTYTVNFTLPTVVATMLDETNSFGALLSKKAPDQELDPKAFTVTKSGTSAPVINAYLENSGSGPGIMIVIDGLFKAGEEITFSYSPTGTKDLKYEDGSKAKSFNDVPVMNVLPTFDVKTINANEFSVEFNDNFISANKEKSIFPLENITIENSSRVVNISIDSSITPKQGDWIEFSRLNRFKARYKATYNGTEWEVEEIPNQ